jgi:hypothetical protein
MTTASKHRETDMASDTVYYRFITQNGRLEFHVSAVKQEVLDGEAVSGTINLDSPQLEVWKAECVREIISLELMEV